MIFPVVVALAAGAALALQAVVNARFAGAVGGVYWAAAVSAAVTSLAALAIGSAIAGPPRLADASSLLPAWAWTGGVLGIAIVAGSPFAMSRLGALACVVLVVLGQTLTALLLDLVTEGFASLNLLRIAGAAAVLAGATMVALAR